MFEEFGYPLSIKSDNGPPFNSYGYKEYCDNRGIKTLHSTPLNPQQNGMAERAMAVIGRAMEVSDASKTPYFECLKKAITDYNSSRHCTTNEVPDDVFFGRTVRRVLPLVGSAKSRVDQKLLAEKDAAKKMEEKITQDEHRRAKHVQILPGDEVVIKRDTKKKGESTFDPHPLKVVDIKHGDMELEDDRKVKPVYRSVNRAKRLPSTDELRDSKIPRRSERLKRDRDQRDVI